MKKIRVFLLTSLVTIAAFGTILYSSCSKDKCAGVNCENGGSCSGGSCYCAPGFVGSNCQDLATTTIDFLNNTYTPVVITVGGATYTINAGRDLAFTGSYTDFVSYDAYTSGYDASGNPLGLEVVWGNDVDFPSSGTLNVPLDIGSDFFYLYVVNNSNHTIGEIDVNHGGDPSPTIDFVSIPNNGATYGIGYYYAFPNPDNPTAPSTPVTLYSTSGNFSWSFIPAIPNGYDPSTTVVAD